MSGLGITRSWHISNGEIHHQSISSLGTNFFMIIFFIFIHKHTYIHLRTSIFKSRCNILCRVIFTCTCSNTLLACVLKPFTLLKVCPHIIKFPSILESNYAKTQFCVGRYKSLLTRTTLIIITELFREQECVNLVSEVLIMLICGWYYPVQQDANFQIILFML